MAIKKVGVVGCGLMGSGIAQVCAAAGFSTVVREVSQEVVEKGLKGIEKNLARLVEKGTITEAQKGEIRGRLRGNYCAGGFRGLRSGDRGDYRTVAGEAGIVWEAGYDLRGGCDFCE